MRIIFLPVLLFLFLSLHAQDLSEYKKEVFVRKDLGLAYRILYPLTFDAAEKYPLLIFLPHCTPNDLWAYFETELDSVGIIKQVNFPFRKEPTAIISLLKQLLDSL